MDGVLLGSGNDRNQRARRIEHLAVVCKHFPRHLTRPSRVPRRFRRPSSTMSATDSASTSKPSQNSSKPDEKTSEQKPQQSQLSGLEDDDEFEEFAVQGPQSIACNLSII